MASPSFIYPSLMLNPISLVDPFPSQWRITAKVNEYAYEMEENELEYGFRVPCFRAKLHCEEVGNPGHQAYVVLYMQMPFTGTEYTSTDMRTQQASSDLPDVALEEFKCYQTLKDIHCEHTPTLIGSSKETQGPDGWVPGGYLFYFASTKVPGVRLKSGVIGKGLFYTLPLPQRDQIREAFKVAYTSFSRTGVRPQWAAQDSLFWDDTTGKVYIAGPFQLTTNPGEWEPRLWKHWFLDEGRITGGKTMNQ